MLFDTVTINYDLHFNIWKIRKAMGLKNSNDYLPETGLFPCKLVGKQIIEKDGHLYNIEKVYVRYYFGWYVDILYVNAHNSHGMATWMSITDFTRNEFMCDSANETRKRFTLVDSGSDLTRQEVVEYINKYCPQKVS